MTENKITKKHIMNDCTMVTITAIIGVTVITSTKFIAAAMSAMSAAKYGANITIK